MVARVRNHFFFYFFFKLNGWLRPETEPRLLVGRGGGDKLFLLLLLIKL